MVVLLLVRMRVWVLSVRWGYILAVPDILSVLLRVSLSFLSVGLILSVLSIHLSWVGTVCGLM